ncbi:hypothetical protein [Flavitalea sp.]|nr:hypothetical protein [Flavitalea sp.]
MNLKDLPVVLFQHELTKARLKIAELSARSAELEIYESVCQNLVMVHFKLASIPILEQSTVDLKELSGLILQSVRDLRKLSKTCYAASDIESEAQLRDLLKVANFVLKLGISNIRMKGMFGRLTNTDFLYLFLILHNLLVIITKQKRRLNSICVYGSASDVRCVISYAGLPLNIGRLTSASPSLGSPYLKTNFKLLKSFDGKVMAGRSITRKKCVQLVIPMLRHVHD